MKNKSKHGTQLANSSHEEFVKILLENLGF